MKFWPSRKPEGASSAAKLGDGFVSLEEALTQEGEHLDDAASRRWREGARVANAKLQLLRGVDPKRVHAIFGARTFGTAAVQLFRETFVNGAFSDLDPPLDADPFTLVAAVARQKEFEASFDMRAFVAIALEDVGAEVEPSASSSETTSSVVTEDSYPLKSGLSR